jgi:hypothetical protein
MKRLTLLLLAACLVLAPACGDDDPATPAPFKVTVTVTDLADQPVEGLFLTMLSDNDHIQDDFPDNKAAVTIRWTMPAAARAILTVEDVAGDHVAALTDGMAAAGTHQVLWAGRDDADVPRPSGRYTVRMVVRDEQGMILAEQTKDMLMATLRVPVGATDAAGRLVLTDKRLFPHLWEAPTMDAVDESGDIMGPLTLDEDMIFRLMNGAGTVTVTRRVQVGPDGAAIAMVWDPPVPLAEEPVAAAAPIAARDVGDPPPVEFELAQPMPNPFN